MQHRALRLERNTWAAPRVEEVAQGVHRIPLPLPGNALRAVNVYAIDDGGGVVLIDAGADTALCGEALDAGFRAIGRDVTQITRVLATHVHFDHYGQASALRDRSGAEILLCADEALALDVAIDCHTWERSVAERRHWMTSHGAGDVLDCFEQESRSSELEAIDGPGRWEKPDRLFEASGSIDLEERSLRVVPTPGHTQGHVGFLDEHSGIYFAGDHVLPHITPSLGFEPFADGQALDRFLCSLRQIRDLDAALVLPGHGPTFRDLARRVDELLTHHAIRLETCFEFIASREHATALEVAFHLRWSRHEVRFEELDALNQLLAVSETITHLEFLRRHDCVSRRAGAPTTFGICEAHDECDLDHALRLVDSIGCYRVA